MARDWYCRIAGQELGPFSASQLRALAAEGRLSPGDPLRQGVSGVWVPAASVKGLFGGSEARPAGRPAIGRTETSAEGRSRPLLRAVPIEDASGDPGEVASLSRLLDQDDAGIDLSSRPAELPPTPPQRLKGWRSTGLDFLADEPPPLVQRAEHETRRRAGVTALGKKGGARLPATVRRGQDGDPAEPIRRWTLPVLVAILIVLLAVWVMLGQGERFGAGDKHGDRAASSPPSAAPKAATAVKAAEPRIKPPSAGPSKPAETASKKAATAESGSGFRPPPPDPSGKKDGAGAAPTSPPPQKTPPKNALPPTRNGEPPLPKPTGQPKTDFGIE